MHQAQSYVDGHIRPATQNAKLATIALNASQATGLKLALTSDAVDYLYSGTVSIGDAVQAIDRAMYTWATVKLYYATFYLTRALLAIRETAIIYEGTKPFSWVCAPGTLPTKRDGPTHKVVLSCFTSVLSTHPLISQPIDTKPALDWLMQRREEANYSQARFCEPTSPKHFEIISRAGVRRSIAAYVRDDTYLYTFDPQHAMLALPIEALKQTIKMIKAVRAGPILEADDKRYVTSLYFDRAGPLSEIARLFDI